MGVFSTSSLEKKKYIFAALMILFSLTAQLFSQIPAAQAGLGFSPGLTFVEDMSPNSTVRREIVFSRDTTEQSLTLDVTFTGNGSEYLSGANQVYFAVGEDRVTYPLTITVPELPTGSYEATVSAITRQNEVAEEGGVAGASTTVLLAAFANVRFTITNEAKQEYKVNQLVLQPSEEQQPLGFFLQIVNTGNVAARPVRIEITAVNVEDPTFTYSETISGETLKLAKPFETSEIGVFTKAQLPAGRYRMDFRVFDEQGLIFEQKDYAFQIFPPGTLMQQGTLNSFSSDKEQYDQNELAQFTSEFKNTGDIGVSAALNVDVQRDEERIETLKTEPVFVPPGKTAQFSIDKRFAENGDYIATGYVNYGIFTTQKIDVPFTVGEFPILYVILGIVGFIVLAVVIVLVVKKRKRSVSVVTPPSAPSPPGNPIQNS